MRFPVASLVLLTLATLARAAELMVAADGSAPFRTLQAALDAVPDDSAERTVIRLGRGTYAELPVVGRSKRNVTVRGEGRTITLIAAENNARLNPRRRELFTVEGDGFILEDVTLHNTTAKGGSQAEAIHVRADRCILRRCRFVSFQDTLRLNGRVYVDECRVEGDVDFVWGSGSAFFSRCELHALHDGYLVQSRNDASHAGYVFSDCRLTGAPGISRYVLARVEPGRFPHSQVIFLGCRMGDFLSPAGWMLDRAPGAAEVAPADQIQFWEYRSLDLDGRPLDVSRRLAASRQLSDAEAARWREVRQVLRGVDDWDPTR